MAAETLERYLHTRLLGRNGFLWKGAKVQSRRSIADKTPACARCGGNGHWHGAPGRLNVLVNLLNKDPAQLFAGLKASRRSAVVQAM